MCWCLSVIKSFVFMVTSPLHPAGISSYKCFTLDTHGWRESLLLYYEDIGLANRM